MTKAFCPGHISCFFVPVMTDDVLTTGSLGAGIRLDKGVIVTVEERNDTNVRIIMDGAERKAKVSGHVIRTMAPGEGFDVTVENELPVSQGMGMSAAGAIAAGLCVASLKGIDESEAYKAAHIAEVMNGGGLGDVAGILGGKQPVRTKAGIPPFGNVIDTGIDMNVSIVILGPKMSTGNVLSDKEAMKRISAAGMRCVDAYAEHPSESLLYELSSNFSGLAGLETKEIGRSLKLLRKGHMASMCMLGNSIFTNAGADEVQRILGDVPVISCVSGGSGPKVIRKA